MRDGRLNPRIRPAKPPPGSGGADDGADRLGCPGRRAAGSAAALAPLEGRARPSRPQGRPRRSARHRDARRTGAARPARLALRAQVPRKSHALAVGFADHRTTERERSLGRALAVLFALGKAHGYVRLFTGRAPDVPFPFGRRSSAPMPLGLPPFDLKDRGLHANLLAPPWLEAGRTSRCRVRRWRGCFRNGWRTIPSPCSAALP